VIEQEEPYEGRPSRTVPREREGESPLCDSTVSHLKDAGKELMDQLIFVPDHLPGHLIERKGN